MRKKIFAWCDAPPPICITGFGNVVAELLGDVHLKYDLEILAINYRGTKKYDTDKWFLYTTDVSDMFGVQKFAAVLKNSEPDLIFLFQDLFNIQAVLPIIQKIFPSIPTILYYPIDGRPVSHAWSPTMRASNVVHHFIYSEFARRELTKAFGSLPSTEILYHGVDTQIFFPLPEGVRRGIKKTLGWENKFVVINVNVFQPRKFIMGTLMAVAMLRHGYKKCICGNYYLPSEAFCPLNGCTEVLEIISPKLDVALYTHMTITNYAMGPLTSDILPAHALNAGWKDIDITTKNFNIVDPKRILAIDPCSPEQLNELYNAADINITSTLGEGFGLSLTEASATGTTTIAPRNSAIPEILRDTGHLIDNCGFYTQGRDNGHIRPIVSIPRMVDALEIEYKKWVDNGRNKLINAAAIDNVKTRFRWEDKKQQLMNILERYL